MSEDQNITVPAGWGQVKPSFVLDLPSGGRVKVRELEIQDLIGLGILDVVDQFSQELLPKASVKGESAEKRMMKDIQENAGKFNTMIDVMDKVAAKAVVEPQVTYVAPAEHGVKEKLAEGIVYAHLIPLEDRLEIFTKAVTGMEDLFRASEGQAEGVAAVADGEGVRADSSATSGDIAPHPSLLPE